MEKENVQTEEKKEKAKQQKEEKVAVTALSSFPLGKKTIVRGQKLKLSPAEIDKVVNKHGEIIKLTN